MRPLIFCAAISEKKNTLALYLGLYSTTMLTAYTNKHSIFSQVWTTHLVQCRHISVKPVNVITLLFVNQPTKAQL